MDAIFYRTDTFMSVPDKQVNIYNPEKNNNCYTSGLALHISTMNLLL